MAVVPHSAKSVLFAACLGLMLSACAPVPLPEPAVQATAQAGRFCGLAIEGRRILHPSGAPVVLHGANLPSLTEMTAGAYFPEARLRDLAEAGARAVRLPVRDAEITPTFIPGPVAAFVAQANALGLLVILSWDEDIQAPVNSRADAAEEWLRLMVDYLKNNPGVWFDPANAIRDVSPRRQRAIAQRLVDVARGYRADNVLVINQPDWLADPDPAIRRLLNDGRVVYGIDVEDMSRYPLDAAPFLFTRWRNSRVAADDLGIGVIAAAYDPDSTDPSNGAVLRRYWASQAAAYPDLRDCP
jgi:hypothetical protein